MRELLPRVLDPKRVGRSWAGLLLSVLGTVTACGSAPDEGKSEEPGAVAAADYPERFAASYCSNIQDCCGRFGESFDLSTCQATLQGQMAESFSGALANPRLRFDGAAAARCIADYATKLSACTGLADITDDCFVLWRGAVAPGGACSDNEQCAASAGQWASCPAGVCVTEPAPPSVWDAEAGKLGDACLGWCRRTLNEPSEYSCSPNQSTNPDGRTCWIEDGLTCGAMQTCEAVAKLGEPCGAPTYTCATGSTCIDSVCAALTEGGLCSRDSCPPASYCGSETGSPQCAPKKADAESCIDSDECVSGWCQQFVCQTWTWASAMACSGQL